MKYILTKYKIKKGKTDETISFLKTLEGKRHQETMVALDESEILFESNFIDRTTSGDFLYIVKKMQSLNKLKRNIAQSQLPIFDSIRAWAKDCLEGERLDLEAVAVYEGENGL